MEIVHVKVKDSGTVAKRRPFTTSGITSGYQRTNITTSGASVIESTAGYLSIELIGFPWPQLSPFDEVYAENPPDFLELSKNEIAARGYKEMGAENIRLAEELFYVDLEQWPIWEDS